MGNGNPDLCYTNHTLCPRRWKMAGSAMRNLLPRHLDIIFEINAHFLRGVRLGFRRYRSAPPDVIIEEGDEQQVRMAYSPLSVAIQLTAFQSSIPGCSATGSCTIFSKCGRKNSTARPTASRRDAGFTRQTPPARPDHRNHRRCMDYRTSASLSARGPCGRSRVSEAVANRETCRERGLCGENAQMGAHCQSIRR